MKVTSNKQFINETITKEEIKTNSLLMPTLGKSPSLKTVQNFVNSIFKEEIVNSYSKLLVEEQSLGEDSTQGSYTQNVLEIERKYQKEDFFTVLINYLKNPSKELTKEQNQLLDYIKLEAQKTYGYYMNPVQVKLLKFWRSSYGLGKEGLAQKFKIATMEEKTVDIDPENCQNTVNRVLQDQEGEGLKKKNKLQSDPYRKLYSAFRKGQIDVASTEKEALVGEIKHSDVNLTLPTQKSELEQDSANQKLDFSKTKTISIASQMESGQNFELMKKMITDSVKQELKNMESQDSPHKRRSSLRKKSIEQNLANPSNLENANKINLLTIGTNVFTERKIENSSDDSSSLEVLEESEHLGVADKIQLSNVKSTRRT